MKGRFAVVEVVSSDIGIILVFETPTFITGDHTAVVGAYGVSTMEDIAGGNNIEVVFDARSTLCFDEEVTARGKLGTLHHGTYRGVGHLVNGPKCAFKFSTSIVDGHWRIWCDTRRDSTLLLGRTSSLNQQ